MRACVVAALLVLVVVAGSRSPVLAQQALLSDMERRAEQGDAESQFILGSMYADGTVVGQDGVVAAQWFRRSAAQGYEPAFLPLARIYLAGDGLPQDFVSAHLWFNIAAARLSDGADREVGTAGRIQVEAQMSQMQVAEAQRLAREWSPVSEQAQTAARRIPPPVTPQPPAPAPAAPEPVVSPPQQRQLPRVRQPAVTLESGRVTTRDRQQVMIGAGIARANGLNSLGVGAKFAGFGGGSAGGAFSISYAKPLDISSPAFEFGFLGGPLWRFKGNGSVTPHIGLNVGASYAKVGRVDAWAPSFGLTLPFLVRGSGSRAAFAIEPSVGGTVYAGEVSIGIGVNVGVAVDVGR